MTVVVGTAGHIDHGKTALLRALTGIDADRLPEERRRGMTIDVGYAWLRLADGTEIDFVDVPGHDRLVGNMLVGAGEIDAAILVVAADDGPQAQTVEHLELLVALGLRHAIAVVTKVDLVDPPRVAVVRDAVTRLLAGTAMAGSPILAASSHSGSGVDALAAAVVDLRDRVAASRAAQLAAGPGSRLAVDRAFAVKGRGLVVTGTLRGQPLTANAPLRLVPGNRAVRARELQVHGRAVESAAPGRVAINLAGAHAADVHRGQVVTDDPQVIGTDRLLVRLDRPWPDRTRGRVHLGTASLDGALGRSGRDAVELADGSAIAVLRLASPVAAAPGDRFVVRRGPGRDRVVGGIALDVAPARGVSRRRQTRERIERLSEAVMTVDRHGAAMARLELHGAVVRANGGIELAEDVVAAVAHDVEAALRVGVDPAAHRPGLAAIRARAARTLRRLVSLRADKALAAVTEAIDRLVTEGRLARDGDRIWVNGAEPPPVARDPEVARAMDRLEALLDTVAPPSLRDAARLATCPPEAVRELERAGRIVVLDDEVAYAAASFRRIEADAVARATRAPLTPAALRDATGTSRKYALAILADLDRRGVLTRTPAGHVPGPRVGSVAGARPVPTGGR